MLLPGSRSMPVSMSGNDWSGCRERTSAPASAACRRTCRPSEPLRWRTCCPGRKPSRSAMVAVTASMSSSGTAITTSVPWRAACSGSLRSTWLVKIRYRRMRSAVPSSPLAATTRWPARSNKTARAVPALPAPMTAMVILRPRCVERLKVPTPPLGWLPAKGEYSPSPSSRSCECEGKRVGEGSDRPKVDLQPKVREPPATREPRIGVELDQGDQDEGPMVHTRVGHGEIGLGDRLVVEGQEVEVDHPRSPPFVADPPHLGLDPQACFQQLARKARSAQLDHGV